MTADEFAEAYAKRSGVTVEWLKAHGREVRPCDCGYAGCEGWQMAHVGEERASVDSVLAGMVERLRVRVVEKMADVEAGQPLRQAAAELGLMPFEFRAIYEQATRPAPLPPPPTIEWE